VRWSWNAPAWITWSTFRPRGRSGAGTHANAHVAASAAVVQPRAIIPSGTAGSVVQRWFGAAHANPPADEAKITPTTRGSFPAVGSR